MEVPARIAEAARARIERADATIAEAASQIRQGMPLRAEPDHARAVARVAAVTGTAPGIAAEIVAYRDPADLGLTGRALGKAEAIQGRTVDYVGAGWLEAGRLASSAVGRIIFRDGRPQGTAFLISDRLLITNNHVIPSPSAAQGMLVEFEYEVPLGGGPVAASRVELDPAAFFYTDDQDDLDFTVVALARSRDPSAARFRGVCPLSASSAKHSVGEPVNIVQHPDGDYKQVVFRENRILHRGETVLHYVADTEPGASGSPVFNDEWHVVALHHWGGPHRETTADGRTLRTDVNEGIRISAIVEELRTRRNRMPAAQQELLDAALASPPPGQFGTRYLGRPAEAPLGRWDARTVGRWPAVELPGSSATPAESGGGAPASRIDRSYTNRRGYNPRFLNGLEIVLPALSRAQREVAARVRGIGEAADPFELRYQHFSVVLNAARRMAFYSICNIDGAKRLRVDRGSGRATSGPEASETWALDPRVPDEAQLSDAIYAALRRDLRIPSDFFARGHLTRREDPNWGRADWAERANDDTYHHPNACPQLHNAFNASQKAWQGLENYVLNASDDSNLRVTVITGPVFDDDDPIYEHDELGDIQTPRRFWKIVARVEDGTPLVFAVLADQSELVARLFAGVREEGFWEWPGRLSREYISTVTEIASLTGLDFGRLAEHDVFAGVESAPAGPHPRRVARPESLMQRWRTDPDACPARGIRAS